MRLQLMRWDGHQSRSTLVATGLHSPFTVSLQDKTLWGTLWGGVAPQTAFLFIYLFLTSLKPPKIFLLQAIAMNSTKIHIVSRMYSGDGVG